MKPKVKSIWFSDEVSPWGAFWFTEYMQSSVRSPRAGYVKETFYTKHIDLARDEDQLLASFTPTTRRSVHHAVRDGIEFRETTDLARLVSFFNRFAEQKGLAFRAGMNQLEQIGRNFRIIEAVKDGQTLVMHSFVCDSVKKRTRLLYGGSLLRDPEKTVSKTVVSNANKAAHYYEMCLFKRDGYLIFDFGGYAHESQDPDLININFFKDGFGGELVCETNYRSLPLHLASRLINWVNRPNRSHAAETAVLPSRELIRGEQLAQMKEGIK